ncbi:MAG: Asp-tRNA(Asn)/Glu-tRNA(Gln) amidotransferase subunit GatA [Chlamydiales bacterium]|nr:Asp-tRNA(Asn)/Glu-tRNA(Gln) amidotransferase subunit GatA [Chlamydiales bacterium]
MHELSATALTSAFKSGALSAVEIVENSLSRIEKIDPKTEAFLAVFKERARKKAEALDEKRKAGKPLGKLAGVPVALKDNMHVKGELTTCGSRFLANYRAVFDATVTSLLEEEDALLIGKTNLDEFAMGSSTENSAFHPTRNPWNLSCSPGGSSGGSTAAVSARLCPLALGSDTGGSIRQPAAFCGTVGFKPTYGRVSRYGLVAFASSLDQIGPLANSVEDAALMMEVIGRHCEKDSTSINHPAEPYSKHLSDNMSGKKIGVPWSFLEDLNPEMQEAFKQAVQTFKSLGAEIIDIDLNVLKHSIATYYIVATAEASTNLARFDGIRYGVRSPRATTLDEIYDFSKQEGFGPEVKNRILLGTYVLSSGYQDAYYKKAQKVRALIIKKLREAFTRCDAISMPSCPFPAFTIGAIQEPLQMYLQDIYTICANLAGIPAINVPCGLSRDKKPLGIQLLGPVMHDKVILSLAHAFEKQTKFSYNPPAASGVFS